MPRQTGQFLPVPAPSWAVFWVPRWGERERERERGREREREKQVIYTLISVHGNVLKRHSTSCTRMFITVLLVIAKKWKQLKSPSTGKRINTLWSIHAMICPTYSNENKWTSGLWFSLKHLYSRSRNVSDGGYTENDAIKVSFKICKTISGTV